MSESLQSFRQEAREWLQANCPESMRTPPKEVGDFYWGGRNAEFSSDDQKVWFERMLDKRWIVPTWPIEYGGAGLSDQENKVIKEEMNAIGARAPIFSFGIAMLGPALLEFGNEEQKVKYLNQIVQGDIRWCQGYSEPNAGSDLSNLQTKAEDNGDHYLVNGSKVWTSYGDKSDWIFALVRTSSEGKRQEGISFLLIDMDQEGVSTSPIKLISGKSPFTETFFDNAIVPKENLVGELNQGWTIAKYLLTHERQMIGSMSENQIPISEIAKEQLGTIEARLADPVLRTEIARHEINDYIFKLTVDRAVDEAKAGHNSGAVSSMFKYYGTELNVERQEINMALRGYGGLEWEGENSNEGYEARTYCRSKGNTIEGGTSEIQLNVLAKHVLKLG